MQIEPPLLRLSQAQLTSLEKCPRLFQHKHIEQLYSFANPEHEDKQALGSRFHLLMQQREMGLPIEEILADDGQLSTWIKDFCEVAPDIFAPVLSEDGFRESEHYRTLQIETALFTVIYDLLILNKNQAQIIDWKTYPQPPSKSRLENSWQTRLYMYVLAETSNYLPENISMTYWFFQTGNKPTSYTIKYSRTLHEQIKRKLNRLIKQLSSYLADYTGQNQFPQIPEGSKLCSDCVFARRCDRESRAAIPSVMDNQTREYRRANPDAEPEKINPVTSTTANIIDDTWLNSDTFDEVAL